MVSLWEFKNGKRDGNGCELWQILMTEPTQHLSKPPSIITSTIETGSLERTFPDSLAARISVSLGFCQEGATEPESSAGGGGSHGSSGCTEVAMSPFSEGSCGGSPHARSGPGFVVLSRSVSCFPIWQLFCLQLGQ